MEQLSEIFESPCPRRMANYLIAFEASGNRHPAEELAHYVQRINESLADIETDTAPDCDLWMDEQTGNAVCPRTQCAD